MLWKAILEIVFLEIALPGTTNPGKLRLMRSETFLSYQQPYQVMVAILNPGMRLREDGAAMKLLPCCGSSTFRRITEVSISRTLHLSRQFADTAAAPVPRKKEGRAARLAAMMERDGHAGGSMLDPSLLALINKDGNKESSDSNKENDNNQESTDRKENDPPIENSQEAVADTTDKAQLIEETSLPSTAAA